MTDIYQSPTLVYLIDKYNGVYSSNSNIAGASYNPTLNRINLGSPPYNSLTTIAHELGHAIGKYQAENANATSFIFFDKYDNAKAYADARQMGEGEAIYYEMKVAQELGMTAHTNDAVWQDAQPQMTSINNYNQIMHLMGQYSNNQISEKELYEEIGKMNADMIPSGQNSTVKLTYNEQNHFYYLVLRKGLGNLNEDYKEVTGNYLYTVVNGNPVFQRPEELKSLLNKAHGHFNALEDNDKDILENKFKGGTVIAQQYNTPDLLYGGKDDDTLKGNSGKDILIGGEGNDTLMGNGGDDIIGGNAGDDTLHAADENGINDDDKTNNTLVGGTGADILLGGSGKDKLIGGQSESSDDNEKDYMNGRSGFDTYYVGNKDKISDTDGQGEVYFIDGANQPILLTGGTLDRKKYPGENVYINDQDENIEYRLVDRTLTVTLVKEGKTLTIENYDQEQETLGIRLNEDQGFNSVFVIDVTGSMGDSIETVKRNAKMLIAKLFKNADSENIATTMGILTYQDNRLVWLDKKANTPAKAFAAINKIGGVSGGTELVAASLSKALQQFDWQKGVEFTKQIWLYGDEKGDDLDELNAVYALSHRLKVELDGKTEGAVEYIPIHTVSLAADADATFKEIARNTQGTFFKKGANLETALHDLANLGTNRDDKITGTSGDNTLNGQGGNDTLSGGSGSDTYVQNGNFGHDTIVEDNPNNQDKNKIDFTDSNSKDYTFSKKDDDLVIANGTNSVTVDNFYGDENKVDSFAFNDGVLDKAMAAFFGDNQADKKVVYVESGKNYKAGAFGGKHFIVAEDHAAVSGSWSDDAVVVKGEEVNVQTGFGADKVYINGSGKVNAGAGDDYYYLGADFGKVSIQDSLGLKDLLFFTELDANEVFISQKGENLQIQSLLDKDQMLTIEGALGVFNVIEKITFANGQQMSHQHLQRVANAYKGHSYEDLVNNAAAVEKIVNHLEQQYLLV